MQSNGTEGSPKELFVTCSLLSSFQYVGVNLPAAIGFPKTANSGYVCSF
jgi:hypothetical protein